jgi:hypothetical protein
MNDVLQHSPNERQPMDLPEAEDAILARWEDPDAQVSDDSEQEATPDIDEDETTDVEEYEEEEEEDHDLDEDEDDPELEDEEPEDDDDDDEETAELIDDEAEVEVTVDGEVHRASVKDLKRLYGQEASLTRKSQAVAQQRKQAEEALSKTDVVLQAMLKKAEERYKPYSEVDMLVASKTMDDGDFAALRFLKEEADSFYGDMKKQHEAAQKEAARDAVKVLQESIPDWSNELYNDIRGYAIAQGLPEDQVNSTVDPIVIQLLNKARLFDRGKTVATVKKKAATKKKVLRSKKAPPTATDRKKASAAKAQQALRERGADIDDIASVLMSRWET